MVRGIHVRVRGHNLAGPSMVHAGNFALTLSWRKPSLNLSTGVLRVRAPVSSTIAMDVLSLSRDPLPVSLVGGGSSQIAK